MRCEKTDIVASFFPQGNGYFIREFRGITYEKSIAYNKITVSLPLLFGLNLKCNRDSEGTEIIY